METQRPNPDMLLQQIMEEQERPVRGKLKIFFGYAAGVGKTYAMLEAAHQASKAGNDVAVGYIEPHTRPETLALLDGLEQIPPLLIDHRGVTIREFDLDRALARRPQLILVDELAHTNADSCRHAKRYQDVEELLKAGIDVYTTVNVQHMESLNDVVASITGIIVRERLPDTVFDNADQVELVDIEPDDLIQRLSQGKIYQKQQARQALTHFFSKTNLVALREIALLRSAERVNKTAERDKKPAEKSDYYAGEHILICLSASPSNAKVIRTAARMADAFHGKCTALFVERETEPETMAQAGLTENLRLAEQLGARIATVYGEDVAYQIAEYAKASGVTKVVIGRSNNVKHWWSGKSNLVERLTNLAPALDIYIIPDTLSPYRNKRRFMGKAKRGRFSFEDAAVSLAILIFTTLLGFWFDYLNFGEASIIMLYILGVLVTALITKGKLYSAFSSLISVFAFNYFFTVPQFAFQVFDTEYPVTFLFLLIVSIIVSTLTSKVKMQAKQAAQKAYRTEVLLETSQHLQSAQTQQEILTELARQMVRLLDRTVLIYPVKEGQQELGEPLVFAKDAELDGQGYTTPDERAVAAWVYKNNKHAGVTTNTLPGARCLYMAVRSHETVFAVAAIAIEQREILGAFEKNLLVAMLGEGGLALEKDLVTKTKNQIAIQAQQEQLRANLLRAISHDLRTPLTSISGNAGILMENGDILNEEKKKQLYSDILDDSIWLINLVENLLSVTRIENGTMSLSMQPELVEEVIQEALQHVNRRSSEHVIRVNLEDDMLMAKMDSRLILQVILNIVDNAIQYTDPGSHITIAARKSKDMILFEISDDGEGIPDEAKAKLFDMFYTVDKNRGDGRRGLGLGLSLCKSIVHAHGGIIGVKDHEPHGLTFYFTLYSEEVNCNV